MFFRYEFQMNILSYFLTFISLFLLRIQTYATVKLPNPHKCKSMEAEYDPFDLCSTFRLKY